MANPAELFEHVKDAESVHFPLKLHWEIPQPFEAWGIHVTKFMIIEAIVAVIMLWLFLGLARSVASGKPPRGRLWNMLEVVLLFIRDKVARQAIGHHDGDRFLPFLWTTFFFILLLNLFGLLPWAGSPTAEIWVTLVLAVVTFAVVLTAGMKKYGPLGFWLGQVPHMDVPPIMAIFLKPMIFVIEVFGMFIKHSILAVRLFANMFAGHLVLAVILGFIVQTAALGIWYLVAPASLLGAISLSLLEVMVAFLQAYVFTFLAALFIGMAVHQH